MYFFITSYFVPQFILSYIIGIMMIDADVNCSTNTWPTLCCVWFIP